jgi:hypothetical protein
LHIVTNDHFFINQLFQEVTEMSIPRLMLAITLVAMLSTSAVAQQQAPSQGGAPAQAGGGAGGGAASGVKYDVTPFFTAVDTDKDGNISIAEWKAAGLNESIFTVFDKDKKNTFAKSVMADMTHPADMDANKDGKLSLDEFKNFTKNLGAQGGGQGGAPGGAQGGAPGGAPGGASK